MAEHNEPKLYRVDISQPVYVIARSVDVAMTTALEHWIEDDQLPQEAKAVEVTEATLPATHTKVGPWVADDSFDSFDEAPSIPEFFQQEKEKVA